MSSSPGRRPPGGTPSRGGPRRAPASKSTGTAKSAAPAPATPTPVKAVAVADPWIGKVLARCRVVEQIGLGRTAVVYRAHHEALHQDVALKVLLPEAAETPALVDRFRREGRWIAQIDNENVLKILDIGIEENRPFMVVELLEGEEVYDVVQREGALELTDAMRILRQSAAGLAGIHARDLIHRDVKPQNLFLLENGTVKVVDFGLASESDPPVERVGTPHFMAPETCEAGKSSAASDIYSLGITFFMLLTGRAPYSGKSVRELMQSHIDAVPLQPERERSDLPKSVADLLRAMTAKDPAQRPTAVEIVRRLDELGGETLKEKGTLAGSRRRKSRAKSRRIEMQVARRNAGPRMALIAGVALAAVVAIVVVATGKKGGEGETSKTTGTTPPTFGGRPIPTGTAPTGDRLTAADVDDPATARAREALAKETEERAAKDRVEREADDALKSAERFARETWTTAADTEHVVTRYRELARRFPGTKAAATATERAKAIDAGDAHPHPDRAYSSVEDVARAREAWKTSRPEVERLLAAGDYRGALAMVPDPVQDASGTLAAELSLWRGHVVRLLTLRRRLSEVVNRRGMNAEPLMISIGEAEQVLTKIDDEGLSVRQGVKTERVPWTKVPPASIATLAETLLDQSDAEVLLEEMALALAHRLEDPFWTRELELGSHRRGSEFAEVRKAYQALWNAGG